jgi:hypothetical protein
MPHWRQNDGYSLLHCKCVANCPQSVEEIERYCPAFGVDTNALAIMIGEKAGDLIGAGS